MLITQIWRNQPGDYFFICTKSKTGAFRQKAFSRKQLSKVKGFIEDNLDKDLYWCPHGFTKPKRDAEHAVPPTLCYADLDEADPVGMEPKPTIALESSPGRYVGFWILDKEADWLLNKRLTYFVGADHGGWDPTQVLRIPHTTNYKYSAKPTVKILWRDGPIHKISDIEAMLPKNLAAESTAAASVSIVNKYYKHLKPATRRLLSSQPDRRADRSDLVWKAILDLVEAGMNEDETFTVIHPLWFNKFVKREPALRRQIVKAINEKLGGITPSIPADDTNVEENLDHLVIRSMEDVEEQAVDWLWYPYLARKEISILNGDPGLGKSYFAQIAGMHLAQGRVLPTINGRKKKIKGKVLYIDLENSPEHVTKRRLVDNNVKGGSLANYYQCENFFSLTEEDGLNKLWQTVETLKPVLIVFDTLNTYMGETNTNNAAEVNQTLAELREIAVRFNCSVVPVMHLNKGQSKALYRGQGSISFAGVARIVMSVGEHPEEEDTRVVTLAKANMSPKGISIEYTITSLPDTLKFQDRSKFSWGDVGNLTADDVLTTEARKAGTVTHKEKREAIELFLMEFLAEGTKTKADIERAGAAYGHDPRLIKKVALELGVVMGKTTGFGPNRRQDWTLPNEPSD